MCITDIYLLTKKTEHEHILHSRYADSFNFKYIIKQMTTTELKTVSSAFEDPTNVRSSGFNLGGEKFFCLQVDEGQIQGKRGSGGVSIAKTLKCCLLLILLKMNI